VNIPCTHRVDDVYRNKRIVALILKRKNDFSDSDYLEDCHRNEKQTE